MPASQPPPSKPPREPRPGGEHRKPSVEVRVKPGIRPGAEVHEIEYQSDPPPPLDPKAPGAEDAGTRASVGGAEQLRQTMPTQPPPKSALARRDTRDFDVRSDVSAHDHVGAPRPEGWDRKTPTEDLRTTTTGLGVFGLSMGSDTELDPLAIAPPTRRATSDDELDLGLDIGSGDAPDSNDALNLVSRHPESSIVPPAPAAKPDPFTELRERYALGDFSGALAIAEGLLEDQPGNADAQRYAESCRDVLRQMYSARLGPLDQVPVVAIPAEQLRWLTLDHRSGFLLSHVDGVSTLEEVLDVSGMNPLEAMRIIYDLLQQKVIALQ